MKSRELIWVRNDEIAETEKRFVFFPDGNVEKSVRTNNEKNPVAVMVIGVPEVTHGIYRVVKLRAAEIFAGFRKRWNEVRMLRARERSHREAVRERSEVLLQFVRRSARRDEMHFVEIEAAVGGARYGEVSVVNRVKGTAEQRDTARVMFCSGAMRLRGGQCASREVTVLNVLTNF